MKTLAYMRTHYIDDSIYSEFSKLSKAKEVESILFVDNHTHFINTESSNIHNINITFDDKLTARTFLYDENIHEELNLPYYTDNIWNKDLGSVMWYCSDYPFYIMRKYYPDYDYYWSIEADCFCNGESYSSLFEKYKNYYSDFIAKDYRDVTDEKDWHWQYKSDWCHKDMHKYGCLFPVVRMSAVAIDFLYNKRLEQANLLANSLDSTNDRWLFCEYFTATELSNNGFTCENLDEPYIRYLPVYNLNKERIFEHPDNYIYHPVK